MSDNGNKKKSPFGVAIQELGLELLLTVVCFGIGALILWACGMDLQTILENDWAVVIGFGIILVLFVVGYAVVASIKKRKDAKKDNQTDEKKKFP